MKHLAIFSILLLIAIVGRAQSIPAYVPTTGLMAYYGFDGNANDLTGNGNNGTLGNSGGSDPVLTADRFGNANSAYQFGGVDNRNWIRVPNSNSLRVNSELGISFWMKLASGRGATYTNEMEQILNDGGLQTIIAKGGCGIPLNLTPPIESGWRVEANLNAAGVNHVDFSNTNSDMRQVNISCNADMNCYSTEQWIHVVISIKPNQQRVWINGVLYSEQEAASPSFTAANMQPLYFGRLAGGPGPQLPFNGALDDVALYNRALTDDDVDQLYHNYLDRQGTNNLITINDVDIVSPCGNNNGTVTFTPDMTAGQFYQYAIESPNDPQVSNAVHAGPGEHRFYVISQCGLWDTVITLVCDCSDDPTLVYYDSICPGESGQRGSIETIYEYSFNGFGGWSHSSSCWTDWAIDYCEPNYLDAGCYAPTHSARSGNSSIWFPTYQGYISSCTGQLVSPAITLSADPSRSTLTFYYMAEMITDGYMSGYNTFKVAYSTSSNGPWTQIWTSGGSDVASWRMATVSLSQLPSIGTYYFRFTSEGSGYVSALDDVKITCDTRWSIPAAVSAGTPGTTVRIDNELENTGICPITESTLWFIKPTTTHDTTIYRPIEYIWHGTTYNATGDYSWNNNGRLKNHYGCDSTDRMHLVIDLDNAEDIYVTACDQYIWTTSTLRYTESTIDSVTGLRNQYGGDSTVRLHLTIAHSYRGDTTVHSCNPYYWQGEELYNTAERTHTFHTVLGNCDSTITLHFVRHYLDTTYLVDSICEGGRYYFDSRQLTAEGNYQAHLQNIAHCDSTVFLTLSVITRPVVSVNYTFDCATGSYILWGETSKGFHRWLCDPPSEDLLGHENDDTLYLKPQNNINFTYYSNLESGFNCGSNTEVTIPRIVNVKAKIIVKPSHVSLDQLTFTATDASTAELERYWYINGVEMRNNSSIMHYTVNPEDDTTIVKLVIKNGLCYDSTDVKVPLIRSTIYVPNVFTPTLPGGNDGRYESNNRFRVQGTGITQFEIYIYTRTGLLVFHSTDINEYWDGTMRGQRCPQGTYSYIVKYKDDITPGNWQYLKGVVMLLH